MTKKTPTSKNSKKKAKVSHPGMMGDGTEEQNLGERGNPAARIKKKEVVAAFGKEEFDKHQTLMTPTHPATPSPPLDRAYRCLR